MYASLGICTTSVLKRSCFNITFGKKWGATAAAAPPRLRRPCEVMVTNFLVQHNLPIATADHLEPLFKEIFPDSAIASSYSCARTKTSAILNEAFAPHCHKYVVEHCKTHAYGVGTDGSNDTGVAKLNPVSIRIFDIDRSKTVTNHIFDMCLTEGEHGAKAFKIFEAIPCCGQIVLV